MRCLVIRVGEEYFGIEIGRVVEILNPGQIHAIPDIPPFLRGVMNVRGDIVPVVSLADRFGIRSIPEKQRVVIMRFMGEKAGLLVDNVDGIIEVDEERLRRPSKLFRGFRAEFIDGVVELDAERVLIIMDLERVLTREDKVVIKKARDTFQEKGEKKAPIKDKTTGRKPKSSVKGGKKVLESAGIKVKKDGQTE